MRRIKATILTAVTVAASALALPTLAGAATVQLGSRPPEGGAGGITGTVSPSVVRVNENQAVTMDTTWSTFRSPNAEFGPIIWRTSTPSPGGGTLIGQPCAVLYLAGSTSCTYKRTGATGSWAMAGFTITLNSGASATYQVPYAVLPADTYNIGGKFIKRGKTTQGAPKEEAAPGVEVVVEEVGGTEKYTASTNAQGQYDVQVKAGQWRVRTTDKSFCHDSAGGGGGGCSRRPVTTTGGDKTVNFVQPGPIDVTGTVTTDDGTPVKDAKVRATQIDGDGETIRTEAVSDTEGNYAMKGLLPSTEIVFDSPVPYICPVTPGQETEIGDNSLCKVPKRTVPGTDSDLTQDFEKPGCVANIDFESSMTARSRCFKLTAPETWETDETFRLNGIDFHPAAGRIVTFNKKARTVDFGLDSLPMSIENKGTSYSLLPAVALGLVSFESSSLKFAYNLGLGVPKTAKFAGFPMSEQATVEMTSGQSVITFKLTVPVDNGRRFSLIHGWPEGTETFGVSATATTTTERAVKGLSVSLENPGNIAGLVNPAFKNPIVSLKELGAGYDWESNLWSFKGKLEPEFLKKAPGGQAAGAESGGEITAEITASGVNPFGEFKTLTLSGENLNRKLARGYYLQRFQGTIPLALWDANSTMSVNFGMGATLGPANPKPQTFRVPSTPLTSAFEFPLTPKEAMGFDGDITVKWSRLQQEIADNLSVTGSVTVTIWDQKVGKASLVLYPYLGLGAAKLDNIGLTDPLGGRMFALRGEAELWLDLRREGMYWMRDRGAITLGGRGVTAEWILTGPTPTLLGACSEEFGVSIGGAINFDDPLSNAGGEDGQCDLAPFRKLKPQLPADLGGAPPPPFSVGADRPATTKASRAKTTRAAAPKARAAKASATQKFTIRGDEGVVPLQVTTTGTTPGLPDMKLSGPGVSITVKDGKAADTKKAIALVYAPQRRVQFVLNKPKKGTYRIETLSKGKDVPLLEAPKFSQVLPEPQVETGLDRAKCSPTIHWSAVGINGQKLRFVERTAAGGETEIGTATAKTGKLTVTPLAGGGRSELFVEVMNGATLRKTVSIGSYTSQVGATVPGPSGVAVRAAKATGKGKTTVKQSTVTWAPVCGAEAYSVITSSGKTDSKPLVVTGTTATIPRPKGKATVTVTSLGRGQVAAGSTLVPLP